MINFAERQYKCSEYKDRPKVTSEILREVTDPDKNLSATTGLEQIIMSREIPRNESFAKLYKERNRSQPYDLFLMLCRETFKCHQFVISHSSDYLK